MKTLTDDIAETCRAELLVTLAQLNARIADARLLGEEGEDLLIALERRLTRVEAALDELD